MVEDRIRELEIAKAVQQERLDALTEAVRANTVALAQLTAVMNQGRGAWWAIVAASAGVSFVTTMFVGIMGFFKD